MFFEQHLPEALQSGFSVIGALVLLSWLNWKISLACGLSVVVILAIYRLTENRIKQLNSDYNNRLEQQVFAIRNGSPLRLGRHFSLLARRQVRLSDIECINFALIALGLMGLLLFSFIEATQDTNAQPGDIFTLLTYVMEFYMGVFALPMVLQQLIRLNEISRRLSHDPSPDKSSDKIESTKESTATPRSD